VTRDGAEGEPYKDHKSNPLKDVVLGVTVALTLGTLLKTFVLGAACIPTASMEGTLLAGDYVLCEKLGRSAAILMPNLLPGVSPFVVHTPQLRRTRRGDIVLFRPPATAQPVQAQSDLLFVKRCVATEGDTVEFRRCCVLINGLPLRLPLTAALWDGRGEAYAMDAGRRFIVPEGSIFLLGDNPTQSSDSRNWGCVLESEVIGKAIFIYWSRDLAAEKEGQPGSIRWQRVGTLLR
jgi:signal peptidase I